MVEVAGLVLEEAAASWACSLPPKGFLLADPVSSHRMALQFPLAVIPCGVPGLQGEAGLGGESGNDVGVLKPGLRQTDSKSIYNSFGGGRGTLGAPTPRAQGETAPWHQVFVPTCFWRSSMATYAPIGVCVKGHT